MRIVIKAGTSVLHDHMTLTIFYFCFIFAKTSHNVKRRVNFEQFFQKKGPFMVSVFLNTVPIGYSELGYSGRAGYSDLIPNETQSSVIT